MDRRREGEREREREREREIEREGGREGMMGRSVFCIACLTPI